MERATELLVHGMQETDAPIADISAALARMAAALNDPNVQARDLLVGSRPPKVGAPVRREGTVELF